MVGQPDLEYPLTRKTWAATKTAHEGPFLKKVDYDDCLSKSPGFQWRLYVTPMRANPRALYPISASAANLGEKK